jgi:sugar phosphate isomerase/epimerase
MQIGIFAKTFAGTAPDTVFASMREAGYDLCQYNMACSGLPAMPAEISAAKTDEFKLARNTYGVTIAALSATYNMIHPDQARRFHGGVQLEELAKFAKAMGIPMLTLCTGSRNPDDQWAHHPDNQSEEAQRDLGASMERAIKVAELHDLVLGIEPEHGNIINSAQAAHALLTDMESKRLKIILDPANLITAEAGIDQHSIIAEAMDLLGEHIVMAHAKDRDAAGKVVPAGRGIVDFTLFLAHLKSIGFKGPLITHGLEPEDAPGVLTFLKDQLA